MKLQNNVWCLVLLLLSIYGCNKTNDDKDNETTAVPEKHCLVTSMLYDSLTEFAYTYDSKRRMTMETRNNSSGDERIYVYGANTVSVDNRRITLNEKGNMVACTIITPPNNIEMTYVYDVNDCLLKYTQKSSNGTFTYSYSWKGGNHVKTVGVDAATKDTVSVFEFTYYENMPNVLANHHRLQTFTGTQSKNLMKAEIGSFKGMAHQQTLNYTYEFGSDGKLSTRSWSGIITSGSFMSRTENYRWNCD